MLFVICYAIQLPIAIYAWRGLPLRDELAHPFANYRKMTIGIGLIPLAFLSLFVTCGMLAMTMLGVKRRRSVLERRAARPSIPPPPVPPSSAPAPSVPPPPGAELVTAPSVRVSAGLLNGPNPRVWRTIFFVFVAVCFVTAASSPLALLVTTVAFIALGALWNPGRRLVFLSDGTAKLHVTGRFLPRRNGRVLWNGPCSADALAADDNANWQRVTIGDATLWISRNERRRVREAWIYGSK